MPVGIESLIPARWAKVINAPVESLVPKRVAVQDGKKMASKSAIGAPLRIVPPVGYLFKPGIRFAIFRAVPAACVKSDQFEAASFHACLTIGKAFSSRSSRTKEPVLIDSGQVVAHMPSTAQVSVPS